MKLKKKFWVNEKGQLSVETIFGVFILLVGYYIFLVVSSPFLNMAFNVMDNDPNYSLYSLPTKTMLYIIPLILAALILLYPFQQSRTRTYID